WVNMLLLDTEKHMLLSAVLTITVRDVGATSRFQVVKTSYIGWGTLQLLDDRLSQCLTHVDVFCVQYVEELVYSSFEKFHILIE
ncbi:hypothetical protein L9F63_015000, partial [Diploptera punctata]